MLSDRLFDSAVAITSDRRENLSELSEKLKSNISLAVKDKKNAFKLSLEKLNALSPLATLSRGYAIAETESGAIKSVEDVKIGDSLKLRLKDGELSGKIEKIKRGFKDE